MTRNESLTIWREKNREKLREYQRQYMQRRRLKDMEQTRLIGRAQAKKRREKNPDAVRAYNREFYKKKKEKSPEKVRLQNTIQRERHRENIREISRRWAANNPAKKHASVVARRAAMLSAIPPWVDKSALVTIYEHCRKITHETGVQHHVDHIIPLRSKIVCGLHVPWNLQVIPAIENARKSNKMVPV